ncbi:unnamed protein product [Blepharisma stoltei]|uniref:SecA DEAD-like N-terminal domain-containing protein n=1 Tax=Blepharisma stoltei TaxID=1481888 RepID=A0AAU9IPN8_9CILI|nr:unnamed protein product [Blepharisma stoltei]
MLTEINDSITKLIKKALNILLNIEHKDDSAEIIEAFKIYSIAMDFKIDCEEEKLSSNMFGINNTIESMQASIIAFYEKLDNSYMEYKPPKNTIKCSKILNKIKQWDDFLQIFKEYQNQHPRGDILKIRGIRRYADFADDLNQTLYDFYDYFLNFRIQNNEVKHPKLLEDCVNNIKKKWSQIKSFEGVKIHLNSNIVNLEEIQSNVIKSISGEIYRIVEDASNLIKKDDIRKEDFNQIQIYYNCLTHFEANLSIKGFDCNHTLRMIEDKIYEKTLELKEKAEKGEGASEIVESMIGMKNISNNFPLLKKRLDSILDEFLETFRKKNKTKAVAILEELEKHPSGLGLCIITEHKFFDGVMQRLWLKKTQEHGIDYALEHIQGSNLNIEELNDNYFDYIEKLGEIQKNYLRLASNKGVNTAIAQIVSEIQVLSKKYMENCRNPNISLIKEYIPELLAYIAWLWVLLNIEKYKQDMNDEDNQIAFITPHPIQVLSIFRMLGIGYNENTNPGNNLVQILTGEGKSITLAFLSSILALLGFDINCACYSEHLSKRDSQDFEPLYTALSICSYIKYGTFNQLCEDEINSKGDIREIVLDFIRLGKIPNISYRDNERPKILLIDEVDVFFTKSFYGNIYRPLAKLKDPTINNLTDYI